MPEENQRAALPPSGVGPTVFQRVGIALGSNLGNPLRNLQSARDRLLQIAKPGSLIQAKIYQTKPVGCPPDSPDFYNTVVEIAFAAGPDELLAATQSIERQLGRVAAPERNAPRVIDVDILYFGDLQIDRAELVLPHPRLSSRRFVLQPLADIRPTLILPGDQVSIADHLRHLDSLEPPLVIVAADW
ncbi:MAG: 2-amino-4-hydroxy-6-hydroxymethyldihydropteridine diphosphokinase [Verrucomicrobia bacterium]|nr:MAG: 2-amino-4-hydroxy-6-hydroxymethyldihydropteridine diphosphokinase [Verrucomicrobiota bacterium]TAE89332.1 MAG: 2-amino-4-hydroxy-6-hydroxymethyldihydropteridine diphosphokinase [Verrucomicrobiota bacterium]TAF27792.1 MAG: 2-amino-4-hydroxy-6-hydroxymethyldihydropteridine diphosphokinase [Verrucomicrobiota bacterium]TAF42641.1 MAG: 2-amino-4-hydroxy-6-hydroxymethyldihydropteridine diphosphokinase [Verrucomicrobiota bacterium]